MQEAIGACRDEIKGAAILWVVFFHAQLGLGGLLYDVQKIGYGGVDMFLFLSGFGLYHSLSRDADAGRYLLRRARRLPRQRSRQRTRPQKIFLPHPTDFSSAHPPLTVFFSILSFPPRCKGPPEWKKDLTICGPAGIIIRYSPAGLVHR